jgi:hypothetical protein
MYTGKTPPGALEHPRVRQSQQVGTWLSLVERTLGVGEVASSNLVVPTIFPPFCSSLQQLRHDTLVPCWGPGRDHGAIRDFGHSLDCCRAGRSAVESASALIDQRIRELGDWRGAMLAQIRAIIRAADPGIVEEWKWRGVPVWSHAGIICTGETYKAVVKLTFAKGAALPDPAQRFNSSLDGNAWRAIDIHDGEPVDGIALTVLIRAATNHGIPDATEYRHLQEGLDLQPRTPASSRPVRVSSPRKRRVCCIGSGHCRRGDSLVGNRHRPHHRTTGADCLCRLRVLRKPAALNAREGTASHFPLDPSTYQPCLESL